MANIISGQIIMLDEKAKQIQGKNGGNPLIKREFAIRALRFNPNDGTPELSEYNTPILEFQGQEPCKVLDQFKVGDVVKVSFAVEGRSAKNQDGSVKYFNTLRAYGIEKMNVQLAKPAGNAAGTAAGTAVGTAGQAPAATQPKGYVPQQAQAQAPYAGNPFFDGMTPAQ